MREQKESGAKTRHVRSFKSTTRLEIPRGADLIKNWSWYAWWEIRYSSFLEKVSFSKESSLPKLSGSKVPNRIWSKFISNQYVHSTNTFIIMLLFQTNNFIKYKFKRVKDKSLYLFIELKEKKVELEFSRFKKKQA